MQDTRLADQPLQGPPAGILWVRIHISRVQPHCIFTLYQDGDLEYIEYFRRAIESGTVFLPLINCGRLVIDREKEWKNLPRLLLRSNAPFPFVLGAYRDNVREATAEELVVELRQAFWPQGSGDGAPIVDSIGQESRLEDSDDGKKTMGSIQTEGSSPIRPADYNKPTTDDTRSIIPVQADRRASPAYVLLCDVDRGSSAAGFFRHLQSLGYKPPYETWWSDEEAMEYSVSLVC